VEAEHAIRAMAFLARDQYRQAIDRIGRALIPPSKRNPATVTDIEKATGHFEVPSLAALQTVLDEVCDRPEAFVGLIGWAAATGAVEPVRQEKKPVTVHSKRAIGMLARYRGYSVRDPRDGRRFRCQLRRQARVLRSSMTLAKSQSSPSRAQDCSNAHESRG